MENSSIPAIISGLSGICTGIIGTYVATILKYRKELESELDRNVRAERIRTYPGLWKLLEVLARYDRPRRVTAAGLEALSVSMRVWFFYEGGIFLSEPTRDTYFSLKRELHRVGQASRARESQEPVTPELDRLVSLASQLRTQLTRDLGTRRASSIADH